jgi:membrane protein implicated in regulation of membrane protease activity
MRAHFVFPPLPRHPFLRALTIAGAAVVLAALVATGLVIGAFALATAALVLAVRRWLSRRTPRTAPDPSIIEGEFTVVSPRPRLGLPRPE